jgi:ABC-type dipeptide/oligopeptide/nickel transport system permease subunit
MTTSPQDAILGAGPVDPTATPPEGVDGTPGGPPAEPKIEGRSPWALAWMRLRRDKVAIVSGTVVILLFLIAIFAPLLARLAGQDPNLQPDDPSSVLDPSGFPLGSFGGISAEHWFGVEPVNGRDLFARIVYGARVSLLISLLATMVQIAIGVVVGIIAGFVGGWLDNLLSGLVNVLLAFPIILFGIALVTVADSVNRELLLVLLIGGFSWPYIARIVRGLVLSLREKEFIEAARSYGAPTWRIMLRELLPNLVGPILVYSTLVIPTNILTEAAFSFLGIGVREPQSSWGGMLSKAARGFYQDDPMFMIIPGVMIMITVLAFNLFGDSVRDALDPKSSR